MISTMPRTIGTFNGSLSTSQPKSAIKAVPNPDQTELYQDLFVRVCVQGKYRSRNICSSVSLASANSLRFLSSHFPSCLSHSRYNSL